MPVHALDALPSIGFVDSLSLMRLPDIGRRLPHVFFLILIALLFVGRRFGRRAVGRRMDQIHRVVEHLIILQ